MSTAADREGGATARYRVEVSEATYRRALAHARRMTAERKQYDLVADNCNAVLFKFGDRLGLEVKRDMIDRPPNTVRGMQNGDGGRSRATWRQPELVPIEHV